jgi:hypothetical protein
MKNSSSSEPRETAERFRSWLVRRRPRSPLRKASRGCGTPTRFGISLTPPGRPGRRGWSFAADDLRSSVRTLAASSYRGCRGGPGIGVADTIAARLTLGGDFFFFCVAHIWLGERDT